jgi:hypothetical protein
MTEFIPVTENDIVDLADMIALRAAADEVIAAAAKLLELERARVRISRTVGIDLRCVARDLAKPKRTNRGE